MGCPKRSGLDPEEFAADTEVERDPRILDPRGAASGLDTVAKPLANPCVLVKAEANSAADGTEAAAALASHAGVTLDDPCGVDAAVDLAEIIE